MVLWYIQECHSFTAGSEEHEHLRLVWNLPLFGSRCVPSSTGALILHTNQERWINQDEVDWIELPRDVQRRWEGED